ncbi:MAG TPA: flagellar hook-associated protein FlgK [Opitutaceae bacterium]|nr:flagellar hook-associated protein FlgK [Opitutaceae bacterium]
MSGLFTTLNSTVMALNAHSRALETSGKNLANVNNPDYARQRVVYGDRGTVETTHGAQSLGLEVLAIQQLRDLLLDRQLMREIGLSGSYEALQQILSRAQAALGQGVDGNAAIDAAGSGAAAGLSAALDDFFNAFQDLAARPTDIGARQTLLQKAAILTDRFRQTDTRLAQVQADVDAEIAGDVGTVNALLDTVASLNAQIARFEVNHPGSAVDLRDQREAALEKLAAFLPVEGRDVGGGHIQVVVKDAGNADIVLVDRAAVTGPVAFTGTGLAGGSPATAIALGSGSVQGALDARDGAVQQLRERLDLLAAQLVTSVNAAYNPTAAGGADFFAPGGLTAGAIALQGGLTAAGLRAGAAGSAGDNSVAVAIAGLATRAFSTGAGDRFDGTFGQFYASAVSDLGQALATANSRAEDQAGIERLVRTQRDATSGVSLDEEMADLVKFQRAFQASSRVFTIVDDLLDTVVNRLGRG